MKIIGISTIAVFLSGSINFKAHGIVFKTIEIWEWDSTDAMAAKVQAELHTWGQSRDFHFRIKPSINLPDWGVPVNWDGLTSTVCITNHGRIPLEYLLQDVNLGYLEKTIKPNHQHTIPNRVCQFWIRRPQP
ncbi:hypothetical protein PGTUg99_015476 [Puccinia graminis f. sp. tritici]|uniref:Uncharacterized protein n=1 Tax=Puccinia graminis f. sp. tritici TaxID=56615 RepID=A0A5B0RT47_PUCGR|nr:hypothetical protein PGTUg99_015476 [Puccinia graminis f. sp. tritici]